ncbi:MAG: toll/interleukin-1 receptor domain-containing protein [Clostridia bacterium]|nr:toll/interleukin-1 receptor domain-containing protein [Clostridia bacterium]
MYSYSGHQEFAFISYSHKNATRVRAILERFRSMGLRFWMDENLDAADEYIEVIAEKVQSSSFFIAFISKDYLSSKYCRDELRFAYENEKHIMAIYLEPCELSAGLKMMLNGEQYIEAFVGKEKEACEKAYRGFTTNIIDGLGEMIYETDVYLYYFFATSVGNGYDIIKKRKSDGQQITVIHEGFPPASDYTVNYVTRSISKSSEFSICVTVAWDFTYTYYREDEYFEECYLYTLDSIDSDTTFVKKETLWKRDLNTGEHTVYNYVSGVDTSTKDGKLHIHGIDELGNKWDIQGGT